MKTASTACARLLAACAATALGTTLANAQGPEVIYSEVQTHASSTVPGAVDATGTPAATQFKSIEGLWVSPSGQHWLVEGRSQLGSDLESILIAGSGAAGSPIAQEGRPVQGGVAGELYDFFGSEMAVLDSGSMAIDVRARGGAANTGEMLITVIGGAHAIAVRQGDFLNGLVDIATNPSGDEQVGNSIGSVHLLNDGRVGWANTPITNLSSLRYPAAFYDHTAFVQSDVTTFIGDPPNLLDSFSFSSFQTTPDGAHWVVLGDDDPSTSSNDVAIYDGAVALRQGDLIPGVFEQITNIITIDLAPNGDWYARVETAGGADWAIRNGQIIAKAGDPILPGSTERWDSIAFFDGNSNGDFIILGNTDSADTSADDVAVFNGLQVVLRENDPVDVDGNGLFDDDAFIGQSPASSSAFRTGSTYLGDNLQLYAIGTLRNAAGVEYNDASDADGFGNPDVFLRTDIVEPVAGDLSVVIFDTPDPVPAQFDEVTYTVMVVNGSPAPASNVTVTTQLDAATTFVSSTAGSHAGGVHTANFAAIPARSTETFQIVVTADQFGTLEATTTVAGMETDPDLANNTATTDTQLSAVADLIVTVNDTPDPMHIRNGAITYDVTIQNNGPEDATNVVATFELPALSTFSSTTLGMHDGSATGGEVSVNIAAIPLFSVIDITIVADIGDNGSYTFNAAAVSDLADLTPADAIASAETTVLVESDVAVTLTDSSDPIVGIGTPFSYTLELANAGPTDAENVAWSVTLPPEVTFVSSTAGTHVAGILSGTSTLIGAASSDIIIIDVTADVETDGANALASATVGAPVDVDLANNTGGASTRILANADGFANVIFTDNTFALITSDPPQLAGLPFVSFEAPAVSPDGTKWAIAADIDTDADNIAEDDVLVVYDGTSTFTALREGVTSVPGAIGLSNVIGTLDAQIGINDAGEYVFNSANIGTVSNDVLVTGTGSDLLGTAAFTVVAREDGAVPGLPYNYSSFHSPAIANTGEIWFGADTTNTVTLEDEYIFSTTDDGVNVTVRVQQGVTIPGNQAGGSTHPWHFFNTERLAVSADGSVWMFSGDTTAPTIEGDEVLTINNNVVIQEEGNIDPVFTSPIGFNAADGSYLASSGDWMARGSNDDSDDWVVRNGALIARTGTPILPGSPENWDDVGFSDGFFLVPADAAGNYVIGGVTDAADTEANAVVVLNGERLISRSGDPIDMDGNGLFDEDTYIDSYAQDEGIISDGHLIANIVVRDGAGAIIGDAVVSFDLGLGGTVCVCETDGNSAQVNVFDLLAYLDLWFVNDPAADIDGTSGVNVFDLLAFLDCWFPASAGAPCP